MKRNESWCKRHESLLFHTTVMCVQAEGVGRRDRPDGGSRHNDRQSRLMMTKAAMSLNHRYVHRAARLAINQCCQLQS